MTEIHGSGSDSSGCADRYDAGADHVKGKDAPDQAGDLQAVLARLDGLQAELRAQREEFRLWLRTMDRKLRQLDRRIAAVENSRIFRFVRWAGTPLLEWRARLGQLLLRSPFNPLYLRLLGRCAWSRYEAWIEQERARTPPQDWYQQRAREFQRRPLFSIVLPVHNPVREWLQAAVNSVEAQTYPHWELCVCDDASRDLWVREYFAEKAKADARVRFIASAEPLGISGALNCAGGMAVGEYVVLLDQDDVLSPDLLYHLAEFLQDGEADLIYTDEDRLDEAGRRAEPIFKPDWSPDLLTSCMYLGHCLVVSSRALKRLGWFRSEFDGSQDYDLALRLTDARALVHHIPRVLYHWRKHRGSTSARAASKPYAHEAGYRALEDAVRRRGWQTTVENGPRPHLYRLRWHVSGEPRVSIVICSRTPGLLKSCLRAIEKRTSYRNRELVIVQHNSGDDARMNRLLAAVPCQRVCYEGPFNFARMSNLGAASASGDILLFLNDDVRPLVPGWLTSLVAQAQRPEVGAVGAKLLYPSGTIQHVGIAIGIMDGCGHPLRRTCGSAFWGWGDLTRNVSAVTGACLAIRKSVFLELQGFDERFPLNYNDADLCLRARQAGYEIIYEPAAVLRHYECGTRMPGTLCNERELWHSRWAALLTKGDPFYNPNLTTVREDGSLALEP
jgi:GT2 family glycosyltransferase